MDAFGDFLADLADFEAGARQSAAARPAQVHMASETRLLLQLRDEVMQASILIAVSTGLANAIERQKPKVSRHSLAVYAPVESPYIKTMQDALLSTDIPLAVCRSVQSFTARVALARRMGQAFATPATDAADLLVDAEILADAWRRAAAAAIEAIDALNLAINDDGASDVAIASTVALLRVSAGGEATCVDAAGRVTIPGWAERRREPRTPINLAATAIVGRLVASAIIRDASPMGLGLEGEIAGEPGEHIVLTLAGGRQLEGSIVWNDGQRFGVSLESRLDASDRLLRRM